MSAERVPVFVALGAMSAPIAPDDIVLNEAEAEGNDRAPLLILEPLAAFLDEHGVGDGEIRATPIGDGHSNVTYLIERGGREVVLRRPPRPPLPPSAHDVLREARLLRALKDTPARVPDVLAVGEDPAIIGMPFYVMERIAGDVIVTSVPDALDTPSERRLIGEQLIDALVEIHGVDWRAAGLEGFGKPTGYLERQLRRFLGLWEINKTREIPAVESVGAWLAENLPSSGPATIVHGDFRLGNTIFASGAPARLAAVLDWEMATIGDPLADLGYLTATWAEPCDAENPMLALSRVTRDPGFPGRAELANAYAESSGEPVNGLAWYQVLAVWKAAIFLEGSYRRYRAGASADTYFSSLDEGVPALARTAREWAGRAT